MSKHVEKLREQFAHLLPYINAKSQFVWKGANDLLTYCIPLTQRHVFADGCLERLAKAFLVPSTPYTDHIYRSIQASRDAVLSGSMHKQQTVQLSIRAAYLGMVAPRSILRRYLEEATGHVTDDGWLRAYQLELPNAQAWWCAVAAAAAHPIPWNPDWSTSTVVALAKGIRDEKVYDRMPILADALMDAGFDHEYTLIRLRDPNGAFTPADCALCAPLGLHTSS